MRSPNVFAWTGVICACLTAAVQGLVAHLAPDAYGASGFWFGCFWFSFYLMSFVFLILGVASGAGASPPGEAR